VNSAEHESPRWEVLLRADADALAGRAALPSARAMLWRTRLRVRRDRERRSALLFPMAQMTGATLSILALIAWLWSSTSGGRPPAHDVAVALDPLAIGLMIVAVTVAALLVVMYAVSILPMARWRSELAARRWADDGRHDVSLL